MASADTTGTVFDSGKAEAFAARMLRALNDGALCLMVSIGHRAGLFDAMHGQAPATSAEIAARAGLDERYVREWLGAMVTSGVVAVDSQSTRYSLPPEHAAYLTRAAAADNIAVFAQYLPLLGNVEEHILACFKSGGGVPYEKFPRFHAVMAEDSGQSVLSTLESHVLPLVPGLAERLSTGARWLDAGCGSGRILNRLAELFPKSRFTGRDLSQEAIGAAREGASAKGLTNVGYEVVDMSDYERTAEPEAFDIVSTFDAVHDQKEPLSLLKGIHRALTRDGVYLMQDIKGSSLVANNIDHPLATFLYTVSCLHCMTVSLAQGGEGLGAMWGEEKTREYLQRAGFRSVEKHEMCHDIQNNWYVVRKS